MAGRPGLFGWSSWSSQHFKQETARQRSTCVWYEHGNEIILHVAQPLWVADHKLRMWSLSHTSWKDHFWSKGQNLIKNGHIYDCNKICEGWIRKTLSRLCQSRQQMKFGNKRSGEQSWIGHNKVQFFVRVGSNNSAGILQKLGLGPISDAGSQAKWMMY